MPGSEFEECARLCPVMIVIPAGSFVMGSPKHEWGSRQRAAIDADDRYNDADHD
jgi:formylglycine-generating enzyme required for sulfatase activity